MLLRFQSSPPYSHSQFPLYIVVLLLVMLWLIQETIHDAIEDSISWPVRKVVPIIPGDYR